MLVKKQRLFQSLPVQSTHFALGEQPSPSGVAGPSVQGFLSPSDPQTSAELASSVIYRLYRLHRLADVRCHRVTEATQSFCICFPEIPLRFLFPLLTHLLGVFLNKDILLWRNCQNKQLNTAPVLVIQISLTSHRGPSCGWCSRRKPCTVRSFSIPLSPDPLNLEQFLSLGLCLLIRLLKKTDQLFSSAH